MVFKKKKQPEPELVEADSQEAEIGQNPKAPQKEIQLVNYSELIIGRLDAIITLLETNNILLNKLNEE